MNGYPSEKLRSSRVAISLCSFALPVMLGYESIMPNALLLLTCLSSSLSLYTSSLGAVNFTYGQPRRLVTKRLQVCGQSSEHGILYLVIPTGRLYSGAACC